MLEPQDPRLRIRPQADTTACSGRSKSMQLNPPHRLAYSESSPCAIFSVSLSQPAFVVRDQPQPHLVIADIDIRVVPGLPPPSPPPGSRTPWLREIRELEVADNLLALKLPIGKRTQAFPAPFPGSNAHRYILLSLINGLRSFGPLASSCRGEQTSSTVG